MFNLKAKLQKTRESLVNPLKSLFQGGGGLNADDEEAVEELLLGADVGYDATERIMERLRESKEDNYREFLREEFRSLLGAAADGGGEAATPRPRAIVVIGVNGVGKTTSIAKLAHLLQERGEHVLLAACDTFRAAAADQLAVWADRVGVDMIRHTEGGDPGAVAFDACNAARSRGADVVVIDTAGRLHTRVNLMEELKKVKRVSAKVLGEEAVETLLVLDATLGQNSLVQAREFTAHLGVDGIILTKLDSTARGGIVIGIRQSLGTPVRYIGVGESLDDFAPFDADAFVDALLG